MRLAVYGAASTLFATFAVLSAFRQRSNFYAASVYLSKSNACMMVLCNFGIYCTVLLFKILQSIFFGKLRSIEIERIHDRLWFTVSENLLALAMYRDEFDTTFVVLFISLIFFKCFHWLSSDRVEWMDQSPTPPGLLFHARMVGILSLIWTTDILLIAYATESVLTDGPSVVLLFEMEYIIMFVTCLSIIAKYSVNCYGQYRAQEHWEEKSTYVFYIELATDFLKLLTYVGFLSLTISFYGLPINVLRDVYYTARSFISKCNNLMRFRQATRNMNERYPNATREEMEALLDRTCIICREDMEFRDDNNPPQANEAQNMGRAVVGGSGPNDTPKKLPCGHVFHFHCLRSWLERQQTCPTCRRPVLQTHPASGQAIPIPAAPAPAPPPAAVRAPAAQHRQDVQLRLRDQRQRLANPHNVMGVEAASNHNLADSSVSRVSTFRQHVTAVTPPPPPVPNPLLSFDIPNPPDPPSQRSLASPNDPPTISPTSYYGSSVFAGFPNHAIHSTLGRNEPLTDYEKKKLADRSSSAEMVRRQDAVRHQSLLHARHLQPNASPIPQAPSSGPVVSPISDQRSPPLQSNPPNSPLLPRSAGSYYPYQPAPVPPAPIVKPSLPDPPVNPSPADADAASPTRDGPSNPTIKSMLMPATSLGIPMSGGFNPLKVGTPSASTDLAFPSCDRTISSGAWVRRGLSTTQTALPRLIPLFDSDSYHVPEVVRRAFAESPGMLVNEAVTVDPSLAKLPARVLENREAAELVKGSLEEQLEVLVDVQERLRGCAESLRGALGVSNSSNLAEEKGKGKEES